MTNLFTNQTEVTKQGGANQLAITAVLTSRSDAAAIQMLNELLADVETNAPVISASQVDSDALDSLLNQNVDIDDVISIDELKAAGEEVLEKALKSQQSKRSRAKGATMTQDNYIKLVSAAIAEWAIRIALNKPKSAGGRSGGSLAELTDEQIEMYENDPSALSKAIRNVQSKKSIYKGKAEFDAESDYWIALLNQEQQLKALRANATGVVSQEAQEALEANEKASELLQDVDPSKLKADEAKKLLAELQEALAARN